MELSVFPSTGPWRRERIEKSLYFPYTGFNPWPTAIHSGTMAQVQRSFLFATNIESDASFKNDTIEFNDICENREPLIGWES